MTLKSYLPCYLEFEHFYARFSMPDFSMPIFTCQSFHAKIYVIRSYLYYKHINRILNFPPRSCTVGLTARLYYGADSLCTQINVKSML